MNHYVKNYNNFFYEVIKIKKDIKPEILFETDYSCVYKCGSSIYSVKEYLKRDGIKYKFYLNRRKIAYRLAKRYLKELVIDSEFYSYDLGSFFVTVKVMPYISNLENYDVSKHNYKKQILSIIRFALSQLFFYHRLFDIVDFYVPIKMFPLKNIFISERKMYADCDWFTCVSDSYATGYRWHKYLKRHIKALFQLLYSILYVLIK